MRSQFWLNGKPISIPDEPCLLIDYLRDHLHLSGTKAACREGDCGSCQVLVCAPLNVSGKSQLSFRKSYRAQTSCLLRLQDLRNHQVITIEGITQEGVTQREGSDYDGGLNPVQQAVADNGASQCGFCSPGLVIGVLNWLLNGPELTVEEGETWINGNLCRCTGYMGQRRSIQPIVNTYADSLRASENRLQSLIDFSLLPVFAFMPLMKGVESHDVICNPVGGGTELYLQQPIAELTQDNLQIMDVEPAIKDIAGSLFLNARTPIQQVAETLEQTGKLSAFNRFNHLFASLPVRNRATLGGNLANASPVADGITLLLVLDAIIHTSQRVISIHDFFTGFKSTVLNNAGSINQGAEIVQWIEIPSVSDQAFVYFDKVSRRVTTDIAVVNCAGCWQLESGRVRQVSLSIGGASPMPVRIKELEVALQGLSVDNSRAEVEIKQLLGQHLQMHLAPISDVRGSAKYRRLLANQLVLAQWQALGESLRGKPEQKEIQSQGGRS